MIVNEIIESQYHAALDMLEAAVAKCPEALWGDEEYENRFWRIAYHALFYSHLYLQKSEKDFVPWSKHREDFQFMGPKRRPPNEKSAIGEPYTKDEVLEYLTVCRMEVEEKVPGIDLEAESGFSWLPFNKLELQFYNIRHLQHHAGQLTDRLRTREAIKVDWVKMESKQS